MKTLPPGKLLRLLAILASSGSIWSQSLRAEEISVDLELVLAIDVSGSVDVEEGQLQRTGYIAALRSPELVKAVKSGVLGKIAVTYIEWAGESFQTTIVDWHVISDRASADGFADKLVAQPIDSGPWTSIGDVIRQAIPKFANNGYQGTRRVIDISGDGPNNSGPPVTESRAEAIKTGITINGLPIVNNHVQPSGRSQMPDLDKYYAACVIGGPGAFLVVASSFKDFARTIRRKLIFEIAGNYPKSPAHRPQNNIWNAAMEFAPGCDIGERRLQRRRRQLFNEF